MQDEHLQRRGLMLVLSSPSGAGKTTISRRLLEIEDDLTMSVSATTRRKRPGETEGKDYYFTDNQSFGERVNRGELLEHAKVFDYYYGTPRAPVEKALSAGRDVLFDIDWQGTQQIYEQAGDDLVRVFILPPSIEALENRLVSRGQNTDESIQRRLSEASLEMASAVDFDYLIVNGDFDVALTQLLSVMRTGRQSTAIQTQRPEIRSLLGL